MLDPLFRYVAQALSTPEDYVKVRDPPPLPLPAGQRAGSTAAAARRSPASPSQFERPEG